MPDKDLHDDMLKLVRYKVLFVKRDYEHAFPEHEELVAENTDASGYTAWKIAEFIQKLGDKTTSIPPRWKEYPADLDDNKQPRYRGRDTTGNPVLLGLPEDDKKYLRVYYEVLERYPRERFKYEERQVEVLEQIRDRLPHTAQQPTAAAASGAQQPSAATSPAPQQPGTAAPSWRLH